MADTDRFALPQTERGCGIQIGGWLSYGWDG
jgi:hypothetical protein